MSDDLVKKFERKGPLATYDLIAALDRNPTIIGAGADICADAKSTIFAQADRIEELEAKLAKYDAQPSEATIRAIVREAVEKGARVTWRPDGTIIVEPMQPTKITLDPYELRMLK